MKTLNKLLVRFQIIYKFFKLTLTQMKRIHFLQNLSMAFFGVSTLGFAGQNMGKNHLKSKNVNKKTIKLSLAQWSLNKSINGGVLDFK